MSAAIITNRALPYPRSASLLNVPNEIWKGTLETIREYETFDSEALVHWGGCVNELGGQVTGLYISRHPPQGYRAELSPEESRWLLRTLRERDEKILAQVHSHPGKAYHSEGDNQNATSFHVGFISIVVPNFGREVSKIDECAIFEFDGQNFNELASKDVISRFFIRSVIEDRFSQSNHQEKSTWNGLNLKQKLIGLKKRFLN